MIFLERLAVFAATHPMRSTPSGGSDCVDVTFPTTDGLLLSGWLVAPPSPRGVVLLCHGIHSTRERMLVKARLLAELGLASLLFDFRARGRSQGSACTLGLREADDVLAAVAWVKAQETLADLPLGALGESLGAAALVLAMARDRRIQAAALEACFSTLEYAALQRCRLLMGPFAARGLVWFRRVLLARMGIDLRDVCPVDHVASIAPRPLLFIHDGLDWGCSRAMSEQLFAAAGLPKEQWVPRWAPHVEAHRFYPDTYRRRVGGFFERTLR